MHVMDAFEEARKALGIDKYELTQLFLDDTWLKDLQKLVVAPGGDIIERYVDVGLYELDC